MQRQKTTWGISRNFHKSGWITTLAIVLVTVAVALALAGSGRIFSHTALAAAPDIERHGGAKVLPPTARPNGYSLTRAAKVTAVFNTSDHSGSVVPVPDTPFQMLVTTSTNTFDVDEDAILYVPILDIDDSTPILGDFPYVAFRNEEGEEDDSKARAVLLNYVYGESEIGLDSAEIKVDGKVFSLGSDYVVGVTTPPLSDCIGATTPCTPGTHYIVIGGFVSGLKKGTHTVEVDAAVDGGAVVAAFGGPFNESISYTVNVH